MKPKKGKTKLQIKEEKKKELAEELEYLRQVEVPESQGGGRKFVHDTRSEEKKEEKEKDDTVKNWLETVKQARYAYRDRVAAYGYQRMMIQNFPSNWTYDCIATDGSVINIYGKKFKTQEGIVFILKSPKGDVYVKCFKTSHDIDIDFNAVNVIVIQVENTIDSARGLLLSDNKDTEATFKKTKTGLYMPN